MTREKTPYGKDRVDHLVERYEEQIAKLKAEIDFLRQVVDEYRQRADMLLKAERSLDK